MVNKAYHDGRLRNLAVTSEARDTVRRKPSDVLLRVSPLLVRTFTAYTTRYLRRHFHSVRLLRAPRLSIPPTLPLVVFLNHPSWWDPLVGLFLAFRSFPERSAYAPIEAQALARYRFFTRLGFFGVEPGTARGAATFLRVGQAILTQPGTALWITPEGRFTDPRQRPVTLRPGIGHLANRLHSGVFLPLALEYPFWEERCPEALAHFGEPVFITREHGRSAGEWTALFARQLEATQETLAAPALRRDQEAFDPLLSGSGGVGGVYDVWRSFRARLRGERFQREHGVTKA